MKKIIITLFIFNMFIPFAKASDDSSEPIKVSLINLIANPSKYNDKKIEICGYYHHEDGVEGGNYIFLSKEYAKIRDMTNSVSLPMDTGGATNARPANGTYVRVVGILDNYDDKANARKEIYIKSILRVTAYVLDKKPGKSAMARAVEN